MNTLQTTIPPLIDIQLIIVTDELGVYLTNEEYIEQSTNLIRLKSKIKTQQTLTQADKELVEYLYQSHVLNLIDLD